MSERGQLRGFGELLPALGLTTGYSENQMTKCKPPSISFLYVLDLLTGRWGRQSKHVNKTGFSDRLMY